MKMFTSSSSSASTAETRRGVITRLKFISTLSPQEKIDSRNLKIESTSIWTPLKRFISGDSRDITIQFFSSTVDRAIEIIDATLYSEKTSEQMFCANVITDLISSVKGLKAAQKTYSADKLFVCEIETLIEQVQSKVFELQKSHPTIFTLKEACVMDLQNNLMVGGEKKLENIMLKDDDDDDK